MKINRKLHIQMLMQNSLFVLLFLALIGLIGAVTREFSVSRDVTQGSRNTLTEGSINVLKQMKLPVHITVYASKDDTSKKEQYRKKYSDFVGRYQRSKPDVTLEFIDPAEQPKLAQDAGIKADGEFVVEYAKRTEHIIPPFVEQDMTNVLVRLSRTNKRPVMYLDGHGERSLIGVKNHDIGEFGKQLEKRGFRFANPDLTIAQSVPMNGAMLIIASPQIDLSEIEVKKIRDYLNAGGNLLWLLDDDNLHGLEPIAEHLGLTVSPGMVMDLSSAQFGADAKVAFANVYGEHAITKNFMLRTLFPEARKVDAQDSYENGWEVTHLIEVAPNGWLEKGKIDGKESFNDKQDEHGPINIAVAIERIYGKKGQRIVVVGNGNFLANTFITNGGNLDLGVNIINWLAGDDSLITIQPKPLKDVTMIIPETDSGRILAWFVFNGFQYFIPLIFVVAGMVIWWRRRKA
jgi:ABC-type uncharacterized transport system involved in gliding motility auxiliary subunit